MINVIDDEESSARAKRSSCDRGDERKANVTNDGDVAGNLN